MIELSLNPLLRVDALLAFDYPASNHSCARPRLEPRRLLVRHVRDTLTEPLPAADINADPCLRRSRFLVTGLDLDKQVERSFYDGSNEKVFLNVTPYVH